MERTRNDRRRRNYYKSHRLIKIDKAVNGGSKWYKFDGQYRKGKIHCSCPMCSAKSKRRGLGYTWKYSDQLKINEMNEQLKEDGFCA